MKKSNLNLKLLAVVVSLAFLGTNLVLAVPAPVATSLVVGSQTGVLTEGTVGTSTFSVTLTRESNLLESTPVVDLTVIGLPSGATASFDVNPVSISGLDGSVNLTVVANATVADGDYPFKVTASGGIPAYPFTGIFGTATLTVISAPIPIIPIPPVIPPAPVTPVSSGGGGVVFVNYGGNSTTDSIGNSIKTDLTTSAPIPTNIANIPNTSSTVLGASTSCGYYLNPDDAIGPGLANDTQQVTLLQTFLNSEMNSNLKVTGIYDNPTLLAVQAFQLKYAKDILNPWGLTTPTDFVYYTTVMKINNLKCAGLNLRVVESKLVPISEVK